MWKARGKHIILVLLAAIVIGILGGAWAANWLRVAAFR